MKELRKILHVDDDPDIRVITKMSLEHLGGFEVAQCASGKEALDIARDVMPDLFLFDVMMPEMSGEELWNELSKSSELAGIPVVFMTAKVEHSYVNHLLECGARAIVEKPFDPTDLANQIRAAWSPPE